MKWNPFSRAPAPAVVRQEPTVARRRSYQAAQSVARYSDFDTSEGSADTELSIGLQKVRAKARSLGRNSSSMKRYIHLMQVNVVGPGGFHYQCRVRKQDATLDTSLNSRVENAWFAFCQSPMANKKHKMRDLDRLAMASICRDGEFFAEYIYDLSFSKFADGLAIHPIEADMLDHTLNTINTANGNRIKLGVEMDDLDTPVAYWFFTSHPGDFGWTVNNAKNRHRRIPAERIIHVYDELRVGQSRGEPPTSSVVNTIKMLDGYREAEVTGRRVMAAQGGFIETEIGAASNIDALADGTETDDEDSDLVMSLEPGTYRSLKPGQSFKVANPGGSVTDFADFDTQLKKDISMGVNISNMSLGMEVGGVSYSGGRTVTIEDRDTYKSMQVFIIDNLKEPIFKEWLKMHLLRPDAQIPPSKGPAILFNSTFRGRGWDWVDPAKDIKANAEALRTRQTSLSRIAADRGMDVTDLILEIKSDEELLKAAGLTLTTNAVTTPVKPPKGSTNAA